MRLKPAYALALAALLPAVAGAQQARFCRVDNVGNSYCHFATLDSCHSAARTLGGACAIETAPAQRQPYDVNKAIEKPNLFDSFRRGQEAGQQSRIREQEHQARMRLLEAQTQAVQRRPELNGEVIGYWMMFRCPTANGGTELTGQPRIGCVVEQIAPY